MKQKWENRFMRLAEEIASWSTCNHGKVGAVFINENNEILTVGFNGAPRGITHCNEDKCILVNKHCIATTHAEQNAIVEAARLGISLKGSSLVTTMFPCFVCIKLLINLGIKEIIYKDDYVSEFNDYSTMFLEKVGIKSSKISSSKSFFRTIEESYAEEEK